MCGFAGLIDLKRQTSQDTLEARARAMADTMVHRGPDDDGVWANAEMGVALSHRRLAIIDCTPSGHQPMISASGKLAIAYNGEIYNYKEIAEELQNSGTSIEGGSDTAVLLAACEAWGVEKTVKKCIGMFAFALWNTESQVLTLGRDRMGIKPLYWGKQGNIFVFGSSLHALRAVPGWSQDIDRDALVNYCRHAYIPGPHTIFEGVQ